MGVWVIFLILTFVFQILGFYTWYVAIKREKLVRALGE